MLKKYHLIVALISTMFVQGQIVINELDSDTPSTDDKEFIELKSISPNYSLDGYVLVLFNGTGSLKNKSYYVIDLDGYSTDLNGIFVIGNSLVSPVPSKLLPESIFQNGPDGVGLYLGNSSDFPNNTLATTTNLIDALVYDTNDADATELMALLNVTTQLNEDENNASATQSIQRKPDGTYEIKMPTPGANNDGSGFVFNGITITVSATQITEGQNLAITFTTQTPVVSDLNFTFTLNSGSLENSDFTGSTAVTIPAGATAAIKTITFVDDTFDEGDEIAIVKMGALPQAYNRLNDFISVRIVDNDYTTATYGTPLNPTYGMVQSTAPANYYTSLEGLSGAALKQELQNIIANPAVVRAHNYGDIVDILKKADQNPLNSNQVWLLYVETPRAKLDFQTSSIGAGKWNREHIYPQSRGGFSDATSEIADGINVWLPTGPNDLPAGHADAHHIRAEDGPENTVRSNRDYGLDYNGPNGNQGSWKGDVARAVFYMAVRYNGLSVVNGNPADSTVGQLGDLASLLTWNHSDPSDDFEMNRNNYIYTWQINRNPFIDYPSLADYIFGSQYGQPWYASLNTNQIVKDVVTVYPNPASELVQISGLESGMFYLYNSLGMLVQTTDFVASNPIRLNVNKGVYLIKIEANNQVVFKKLIVK